MYLDNFLPYLFLFSFIDSASYPEDYQVLFVLCLLFLWANLRKIEFFKDLQIVYSLLLFLKEITRFFLILCQSIILKATKGSIN